MRKRWIGSAARVRLCATWTVWIGISNPDTVGLLLLAVGIAAFYALCWVWRGCEPRF